jgi:hypothetical protein
MGCFKMKWRLSRYLDGDLSSEHTIEVEQHLDRCPRCRKRLEQFRLLVATSRDLTETHLHTDLWPDIQRRALMPAEPDPAPRRRPAPLTGWRPRLAWALGLASLLLIFFIVSQQLPRPAPQAPKPPIHVRQTEEAKTDIALARAHYERSAQALETIVAHRSHDIDLDHARLYRDKLEQLETIIAECSQALEHNRYDRRAQQTLFNAYDQKISTLREMAVTAGY